MKFIKVEQTSEGFFLDPAAYLAFLHEHSARLPPGAAAYACDPQHFDFYGTRCVKDLRLASMALVDGSGTLSMELKFTPNKFKHDSGLMIRYLDLLSVSVDALMSAKAKEQWPETRRLGEVQLDEVLAHEAGCSHEIRMTGGTVLVISADLVAEWQDV